ncbi:cob(I)yrinic acid a,c-diamide adenosyltransferase [Pararhizobium mangrovi]|uniref:Corrinoid adenosyltransferase n=1 Tax=Pararhizobium mangrovi TaxID=2590452 RepID=A0A506TV48_9HYPH|nr:cob(I)yrinic acid a,c-diamide adenosyltransferase [Pararhizobium mangrovi]TPW25942.1 cob(I)yrinic acid a,c-diamide adenosyltransferase [Pararhizobium mangrovi]
MVVLNKIYTRTGDDGTTALGNGERRPKFATRVAAYGTVDETNAVIGLARLHTAEMTDLDAMLARIQNDCFDVGADLARPASADEAEGKTLRVSDGQVERLETEIDALNGELAPLRSFVLPGGSAAAAHLHHARTVARRAERLIAELSDAGEIVNAAALRYVNRLSDFLFVAARCANENGKTDVLWEPGKNR